MPESVVAQTAFGPMVLAAVEQHEPPSRRLVDDDLAAAFLPHSLRALSAVPSTVHLVPVDFERDDLMATLAEYGYQPERRTLFVWEGVTQYLTENAVRATMAALEPAAPGSALAFTYVHRDFIDGVNLYGAKSLYRRFRRRRDVWHFGLAPADVDAWLAPCGWQVIENAGPDYFVPHYIAPTGRRLGRHSWNGRRMRGSDADGV